ncbi:DUF4910 domain-containing protein [Euzebya rosea]|uniref:DUF4910 domain-containing protein n=1 Tax=Euzebya rosea TaxID=2052804 RepID=UPI00196AEA92|nr:DUF4910 domain-containing protein [Euzebya rosea]
MTDRSTGRADVPDGEELLQRAAEVVAVPRALTGDGVRTLLERLRGWVPGLRTVEVPSGQQVLDWTVPEEWNLRRAVLTGPDGAVVADSDRSILEVVGYSEPVDTTIDLVELQGHLHSLPDQPDVVPWRNSYYRRTWGFCLPDRVRQALPEGRYRAVVDADLGPGHLSYGELVLPGRTAEEVLVTAHLCHPAMANDNASGLVVAAAAAAALSDRPLRRTHRFLFGPGTIGVITWLATHPDVVRRVVGGVVLSGVADPGEQVTYKRSRRGDAPMDTAMRLALRDSGLAHALVDYTPWGYDERQLNSLGYDLGVGLLQRTPHGTYPEYHTSADDLSFLRPTHLSQSLDVLLSGLEAMDADRRVRNLKPHGEPQLGPRGLWPSIGGTAGRQAQMALLWVLAMADGSTGVLEIADRSGLPVMEVARAADALSSTDLLDFVD